MTFMLLDYIIWNCWTYVKDLKQVHVVNIRSWIQYYDKCGVKMMVHLRNGMYSKDSFYSCALAYTASPKTYLDT